MGSAHALEMERKAELELEEALNDPGLSTKERTVIEEQPRNIRKEYDNMIQDLYV